MCPCRDGDVDLDMMIFFSLFFTKICSSRRNGILIVRIVYCNFLRFSFSVSQKQKRRLNSSHHVAEIEKEEGEPK